MDFIVYLLGSYFLASPCISEKLPEGVVWNSASKDFCRYNWLVSTRKMLVHASLHICRGPLLLQLRLDKLPTVGNPVWKSWARIGRRTAGFFISFSLAKLPSSIRSLNCITWASIHTALLAALEDLVQGDSCDDCLVGAGALLAGPLLLDGALPSLMVTLIRLEQFGLLHPTGLLDRSMEGKQWIQNLLYKSEEVRHSDLFFWQSLCHQSLPLDFLKKNQVLKRDLLDFSGMNHPQFPWELMVLVNFHVLLPSKVCQLSAPCILCFCS